MGGIAAPAWSDSLPAELRSPDGRVVVHLAQNDAGNLTYRIERNGETVIADSQLRLQFSEGWVSSLQVRELTARSVDQVHKLTATKAATARDHFNELTVSAAPNLPAVKSLQWVFRAYDDGVAFRYLVPASAGLQSLAVRSEDTEFTFGADYDCHGFNVARVDSSHEGEFDPVKASRIREHNLYDLPLACRTAKNAFAIGEADLVDYGGMYLGGRGDGKPGVQARVSRRLDDEALIARITIGPNGAGSPWRVIMLGDRLGALIESNLVGNLNPRRDVRHRVDQARQDGLGLVVRSLSTAAGQGRHRHAHHQALHRLRGRLRFRIHDDRRRLVPQFRARRQGAG